MKEVNALFKTLMDKVDNGTNLAENRTGTDSVALFGHQMRFNMSNGFPLVTCRQIFLKGADIELRWMLRGDTNIRYLNDNGVTFWDQWADANGELGPVYGAMWRFWPSLVNGRIVYVDQIENLIMNLKTNPTSRRHLVSAWNPALLPDEKGKSFAENVANGKQALPPCHFAFQFSARKLQKPDLARWSNFLKQRVRALEDDLVLIKEKVLTAFDENDLNKITSLTDRRAAVQHLLDDLSELVDNPDWREGSKEPKQIRQVHASVLEAMPEYGLSLKLEMRSNDIPLGLPTNIAEYAMLLHLVAKECGMMPEDYIHDTGDTHIYENQFPQVREQITREPFPLPMLQVDFHYKHDPKNLDPADFFYNRLDDVKMTVYGYRHHPAIKYDKAAL